MIAIEPLLKKPEVARMLSMSESWLERETADGNIPCIHFGRSVRYDVADLKLETHVVASAGGNVVTSAKIDGRPVVVGLNAYVRK